MPIKLSSHAFIFLTTALGLLTINLAISLPAKAEIVCEEGTVSKNSNGSTSSCSLAEETNVKVKVSGGNYDFVCKAETEIFFNNEGQFKSCQLANEIQIRQGNLTKTCQIDSWVNLTTINNDVSIDCSGR